MNRALFSSILALDSYNRGYGKGVVVSGSSQGRDNEVGRVLGNATIASQDVSNEATNSSFYAVSYNVGGVTGFTLGEQVIAFRGTDAAFASPFGTDGSDIANGYSLTAGDYNADQARLALQFYQSAIGFDQGANPFTANVIVTRHSLGAGLAANDTLSERLAA